jgi:hypothetical protein
MPSESNFRARVWFCLEQIRDQALVLRLKPAPTRFERLEPSRMVILLGSQSCSVQTLLVNFSTAPQNLIELHLEFHDGHGLYPIEYFQHFQKF